MKRFLLLLVMVLCISNTCFALDLIEVHEENKVITYYDYKDEMEWYSYSGFSDVVNVIKIMSNLTSPDGFRFECINAEERVDESALEILEWLHRNKKDNLFFLRRYYIDDNNYIIDMMITFTPLNNSIISTMWKIVLN